MKVHKGIVKGGLIHWRGHKFKTVQELKKNVNRRTGQVMYSCDMENWKEIPNTCGDYIISNKGEIVSLKFNKRRTLKLVPNDKGYLGFTLTMNGKTSQEKVHQLMAEVFLGHKRCGYKKVVDHINNIKTDNRLENIQVITHRENCSKDRGVGHSKYIGVTYDKRARKWKSSIQINGEQINFGSFDCEHKAGMAYQNKLKSLNYV